MEDNSNKEQIVDVRSVVEAVSAEDNDAPLYQVESLRMRCGENEYERLWEQNEELGLNDIDTSSADAAYNSTDTKMGEKSDM